MYPEVNGRTRLLGSSDTNSAPIEHVAPRKGSPDNGRANAFELGHGSANAPSPGSDEAG
jgi:hypothetical protein